MKKANVAVLFGGMSTEHEVSCRSAVFVIRNIDREKYDVRLFGITKKGVWYLYEGNTENIENGSWVKEAEQGPQPLYKTEQFIKELKNIDIVFPVLHGKNGEDGTIQGFLQVLDIPYVGCGVLASSGCMDKSIAKAVFETVGIPQGKYVTLLKRDIEEKLDECIRACEEAIEYPCFVKPANAGSSVGVSKVYDKEQLSAALQLALQYDGRVLVEEYIKGLEIEISVMGNEEPLVSGTGKIIAGNEFYDYHAKYISQDSKVIIPSGLDKGLEQKVKDYAVAAYKAMDCSGFARIDFFVNTEEQRVCINEINTIPGFTSISMYPKLWEKEGINGKELITRLIEYGFNRYDYVKSFKTEY
ncbi:MAG: D-alanine--D-alanine ligase family protein [Clostridia bacterium]|jgi:D-alanine-D-alanine ligase|nr:D-alanine--D-alanine ligase [Clostridiaceae bacterium]